MQASYLGDLSIYTHPVLSHCMKQSTEKDFLLAVAICNTVQCNEDQHTLTFPLLWEYNDQRSELFWFFYPATGSFPCFCLFVLWLPNILNVITLHQCKALSNISQSYSSFPTSTATLKKRGTRESEDFRGKKGFKSPYNSINLSTLLLNLTLDIIRMHVLPALSPHKDWAVQI